MKMAENMIKKLEAKGFKRWTKGEHDRLYANVENFGLELHHYNSGNISGATLNGEKISNSYGAEIKRNTSIYLNVNDGKLYLTDRANDEIVANVKAAIAEAEEEAAAEEATQEFAETENAVAEVEAATNLTGTPAQIAAAQKIIEDQKIFVEKKIRKFQEKLAKNAGNEKRVASYTKKINAMRGALCWAIENITSAQWWIRGAKCTDYGAPVCDAGVGGWSAIFTKYLEDPDMNFISNFLDDIK